MITLLCNRTRKQKFPVTWWCVIAIEGLFQIYQWSLILNEDCESQYALDYLLKQVHVLKDQVPQGGITSTEQQLLDQFYGEWKSEWMSEWVHGRVSEGEHEGMIEWVKKWVIVVAFLSWTLWGPPGMCTHTCTCTCTSTGTLHREDCVWDRFHLPCHVGSRTPSSEGFIWFPENEVCYVRSLLWLKIIPTQQDIATFDCSLSVLVIVAFDRKKWVKSMSELRTNWRNECNLKQNEA